MSVDASDVIPLDFAFFRHHELHMGKCNLDKCGDMWPPHSDIPDPFCACGEWHATVNVHWHDRNGRCHTPERCTP